MPLLFSDADFQEAWKELDEPRLEGGWELFTENTGVQIYRLLNKETCLYEYKVVGTLSSCSPEVYADVYMDLEYRKEWDSYVKELHEQDYEGQKTIYWEVNYPFPLNNRDYVYVRERRNLQVNGRRILVVMARSVDVPQCPEKPKVIRVKGYKHTVALETDGARGTKLFMSYFDNPGGNIPVRILNWAAKTAVPGFLKNMHDACIKYTDYCQNRK